MRAAWTAGLLVVAGWLLPTAAAASSGDAPVLGAPVRVQAASGFTEPRIVTAPDGTLVAIVNGGSATPAHLAVRRPGKAWTSSSPFPGQQVETADLDVAVTTGGRVIATELDAAGFGARIAFTDNFGASWTTSVTASALDVDRPWLATGPGHHVYLLFHNLLTGLVSQNMFVETSTDDGATFGLPVPITLPPTQAFLDLQCADASGPSSIVVDPHTGRLYVSWATRTSSIGGGCGASVKPGPVQISLVSSTRIWVATSPNAAAGSWTSRLVVDDSPSGRIVAMQFAPLAVDSAGILYLASQESPHTYPDYDGAALQYRWSSDGGRTWSPPRTIVPPGGAGTVIPEVIAGAPDRLVIAYLAGVHQPRGDPAWLPTLAVVGGATRPHPSIAIATITTLSTARMTASRMMGQGPGCAEGPAAGLVNGFALACGKAQDDFGVTRDGACRVAVSWSADNSTDHPGVYVSEQVGGPDLCGAGTAPAITAPPTRAAAPTPRDHPAPRSLPTTGQDDTGALGLVLATAAALVAVGSKVGALSTRVATRIHR